MTSGSRKRAPPLTLVKGMRATGEGSGHDRDGTGGPQPREIDWSILMARAQAGDSDAYRRQIGRAHV